MKAGLYKLRMFATWLGVLFCTQAVAADAPSKLEFNRDIRPILSENCFLCHGPDKNNRKANLRLDVREVALEAKAIVPGKPDESELIYRINTDDEDDLMPPVDTHKKLTAADKKILQQWISQGAEYQPHWAYIVPVRPKVPTVKNRKWISNPIDAFVLAKLESKKIKPSSEASKRVLIRRLSLDLIGLPPSPEEVTEFLADKSPDAYERLVDRLLASPHFGERMAVPWLDVVRFSDTVGYHGDQNQRIFPYRDYVINAFNQNKPFDQFTVEQLAGDLLPNPATEQIVATGFNRLNMMTREGGAQDKEYLAKYQADRVRTVSAAWLGSTMACCECHDHKYDPFSTKDFYQMEAFFADLKQWGVYTDYGYTPNPDLKGWDNDHPFPPEIEVESPYLKRRIHRLRAEVTQLFSTSQTKLNSDSKLTEAFENWQRDSKSFLAEHSDGWLTPMPNVTLKLKDTKADAGTNFSVSADGIVTLREKERTSTSLQIELPAGWVSAIRLETLPDSTLTNSNKRRGGTMTFAASYKPADGKERKLAFAHADADHKQVRYANGYDIIGIGNRWALSREQDEQTGVWLLDKPLHAAAGGKLKIELGAAPVESLRISISPLGAEVPLQAGADNELQTALTKTPNDRTTAERALLAEKYLLSTGWDASAFEQAQNLFAEIRECRDGRAFTMVSAVRGEPNVTRVLPRGNWQDESGEIVEPATPHFLAQPERPNDRRLTRLDLARWLVSPENPLTARAVINRVWKDFFGSGIAPVIEDLGAQGEVPSHPELLDWLAVEFRESGWNVKHMVKLMVMSSTYRQNSNERPDLKDSDPANRLLAAQNPRRLEAELVRDNALAIADLLNLEIGGPSAFPYQPPGYYVNLQFPDREYYPDTDERQYRRGVYTHWQRTFLHPMMANFDAPSREECTANRIISNSPQQALTLLNDPTFVECSRVFAQNLLTANLRSDESRLELAFQNALARSPKAKEKQSLLKFLAVQRENQRNGLDEPEKFVEVGLAPLPEKMDVKELAAWTQVCRVILNLHETITKY